MHVKDDSGTWVTTDIDRNQQPGWWSGGHGLYSTPRDYLRFQQMLLCEGTFSGGVLLERSTVQEAFANQIGDLWVPSEMPTANPEWSGDFVVGPERKWGWGLLLNTRAQHGMRAAGSGSWAGAFNTNFWVDSHTMLTGALYAQALPFASPDLLQIYAEFERSVYASR